MYSYQDIDKIAESYKVALKARLPSGKYSAMFLNNFYRLRYGRLNHRIFLDKVTPHVFS